MKYCKQCGSSNIEIQTNKTHCLNCLNSYYHNPKGGVALLLVKPDGKLVLTRRKLNPWEGKLGCIGGFVDVGENFEKAVYREAFEEAGVKQDDLHDLRYLTSVYDDYPWQNRIVPIVTAYFMARLVDSVKLIAKDDVASFEYIKLDNVEQEEVGQPGVWRVLAKINQGELSID